MCPRSLQNAVYAIRSQYLIMVFWFVLHLYLELSACDLSRPMLAPGTRNSLLVLTYFAGPFASFIVKLPGSHHHRLINHVTSLLFRELLIFFFSQTVLLISGILFEHSGLVLRLTVVYFPRWQREGKVSLWAMQIFSTIRPSSAVNSYVSMMVIFTASFFPFLLFLSFLTAGEK